MVKSKHGRREKLITASEGYQMLGMFQNALNSLDEIDDPEGLEFAGNMQRGLVLRDMKEYRAALESFDQAAHEKPDDVSLLLAMAWCYKRTDQLPKAIQAMERAHQAAPEEAIVLYNLACYWTLAGNKSQALSWLGRALRMNKALRDSIPDEPDFDSLRDDPDFENLLNISSDDASRSV